MTNEQYNELNNKLDEILEYIRLQKSREYDPSGNSK